MIGVATVPSMGPDSAHSGVESSGGDTPMNLTHGGPALQAHLWRATLVLRCAAPRGGHRHRDEHRRLVARPNGVLPEPLPRARRGGARRRRDPPRDQRLHLGAHRECSRDDAGCPRRVPRGIGAANARRRRRARRVRATRPPSGHRKQRRLDRDRAKRTRAHRARRAGLWRPRRRPCPFR